MDILPKWLFYEVRGLQVLFLWPALRCSCSRSGQLHSGYFAACERTGRFPQKWKPNKASTFAYNAPFDLTRKPN